MSFQALQDLPAHPPSLLINGEKVDPYMVDWRTGEEQQVAPAQSIDGVPSIKFLADDEPQVQLINTASPSGLTVGVYPGAVVDIDPSVPPETIYDCIAGGPCTISMAAGIASVPLTSLMPAEEGPAVFVVTATYFAESAGTPFANKLAWVFELTP